MFNHIRRKSLIRIITNSSMIQFPNTHFTVFARGLAFEPQNPEFNTDNKRVVVDGLVSMFTRRQFGLGDLDELSRLGSQLTPEIIANVLKELKSWMVAYKFFNWAKAQKGYFHNWYTFNTMASILSRVRRNAPMKSLVLEVMNESICMSSRDLGFFIRCLGSVGLVEEANLLFDRVREMGLCVPDRYCYSCLLEVMAKSSLSDLTEKRLDEMRSLGWVVDKYALTTVLSVYCNAREYDKALMIFKEMLEKGWLDTHVLSILALSFTKWGEVDKAFELIERMEECNLRLNKKTFYVLVNGFISNHRVDKALQLFDKMCGAGFSLDIAVYDVLIRGLCNNKDTQGALRVYSKMSSLGICPDVKLLNNFISCVSDEDEMADLLEKSGDNLDDESVRSLYSSVLNALVGNGQVDRALDLVKRIMEDRSQDVSRLEKFFKLKGIVCLDSSSVGIIINALYLKGRLDEALKLFKVMDKFGCQKNTLLYNNLIAALCNADRVIESIELLTEMKKNKIQRTQFTYNSFYGYFCRKGDVIEAKSIVKEICVYRYEPWIKYSTTLVKQLCKQGRAVEACTFLAEMAQEGLVPHFIPYFAAIDGLFKIKEVDNALELYRILYSRGYRPDVVAYNILIDGLCKANRMSEAEKMLKEMFCRNLLPSTVTYNSLIDGWCKNYDIDKALALLSKMVVGQKEPNVVTYTTLIDGLCKLGRPNAAIMIFNEMDGKSCSPNRVTFMALINGLCKNNMPDMALIYLREMEKKEMRADNYVYIALLDSFVVNKKVVLGLDMLKEIVEKELCPTPLDKNYALVKGAIVKLADDPLTSCGVNKLVDEGGIPESFTLCKELKNETDDVLV